VIAEEVMAETEKGRLRSWRLLLYSVVVLTLLLMAFVRLSAFLDTGYPVNLLALNVARICMTSERLGGEVQIGRGQESVGAAWLGGMAANCQGEQQEANEYWLRMLSMSDLRLHALRAAGPEAVELAQSAVAADGDHPDKLTWLGDTLYARGDYSGAISAYARGLEGLGGDNGNAWRKLGDLYLEADDWQNAAHAYSQACFYVDRGKNGCPLAGRLYMEHGEYELAAERFRTSLKQLPGWLPGQRGLVDALMALDRGQEALPYLENLAENGDAVAQEQLQGLARGDN
jgi:tetratricopeptide (TPR) repeat protein